MSEIHSETHEIICEPLKVGEVQEINDDDVNNEIQKETKKDKFKRKIIKISNLIPNKMSLFLSKVAMLSWYKPVLPAVLFGLICIPILCGFVFIKRSDNYLSDFYPEGSNEVTQVSGIEIVFRNINKGNSLETTTSTLTRNVMDAQLKIARSVQNIYNGAIEAAALLLYDINDDPFLMNSPIERLRQNPDALTFFDNVFYDNDTGEIIGTGTARMRLPSATDTVIETLVPVVDETKDNISGGITVGYMFNGAINIALDNAFSMNMLLSGISVILSLLMFIFIGSSCFKHGMKDGAISIGLVTICDVILCLSCGIAISFYAGHPSNPEIYYSIPCNISLGLISMLFILHTYKKEREKSIKDEEKLKKSNNLDEMNEFNNDNNIIIYEKASEDYISLLRRSFKTSISGITIITLTSTTSFACLASSNIVNIKTLAISIGLSSFLLYVSIIFVLSPFVLFDARRRAMQKFDVFCCFPKPRCEKTYELSHDFESYEVDSLESVANCENIRIVMTTNTNGREGKFKDKDNGIEESQITVVYKGKHKPEKRRDDTKPKADNDKMKLEHLERQKGPPLSRRKIIAGSVTGCIILCAMFVSPIVCISLGLYPDNSFDISSSLPEGTEVSAYASGMSTDRWTPLPLLLIGVLLISLFFTNIVSALITLITSTLVVMLSLVIIDALNIKAGGFTSVGIISVISTVVFCCTQSTTTAVSEVIDEKRFFIRATKAVKKSLSVSFSSLVVFAMAFVPLFFSGIGVLQLSCSCALITSLVGFVYETFFAAPVASLCSGLFVAREEEKGERHESVIDADCLAKVCDTGAVQKRL